MITTSSTRAIVGMENRGVGDSASAGAEICVLVRVKGERYLQRLTLDFGGLGHRDLPRIGARIRLAYVDWHLP